MGWGDGDECLKEVGRRRRHRCLVSPGSRQSAKISNSLSHIPALRVYTSSSFIMSLICSVESSDFVAVYVYKSSSFLKSPYMPCGIQ